MRFRTIAAFAAGVVVAAAGTAYATTKASIIGADNQIHACYLENAGLLRVVPEGAACRDNETAISWDAHGGPVGPPGPAGPAGPAGPKGDAGASWRGTWSSSASYAKGDLVRYNGAVWINTGSGIVCRVGTPCGPFVPGSAGGRWAKFAQDGALGPTGGTGPAGPAGPTGPTGPAGPPGPQGPPGTGTPATSAVWPGWTSLCAAVNPNGCGSKFSIANCPAGTVVTGGGWEDGGGGSVNVSSSEWEPPNGWVVFATGGLTDGGIFRAYAMCLRLQ